MSNDRVQTRTREAVNIQVTDAFGNRTNVSVFQGLLPEDMLEILMKQRLIFRTHQAADDEIESNWTGPDEKIQRLLCSGYSSVPASGA